MAKTPLPKGRIGLSISGGGAQGNYHLGHIEWLRTVGRIERFSALIGTSTGALIAAKLAALQATGDEKHWTELKEIYTTVETAGVIRPQSGKVGFVKMFLGDETAANLVAALIDGEPSVYDIDPLIALVDRYMPEDVWDAIMESEDFVGFCYTDLHTGIAHVLSNRDGDADRLRQALLASTCQPVLMPVIEVDADEPHAGVDGGVRDVNPVRHMQSAGALDAVIALYVDPVQTPEGPEDERYQSIFPTLARTLQLLVHNTVEGDRVISELLCLIKAMRERARDAELPWDIGDVMRGRPLSPDVKQAIDVLADPQWARHSSWVYSIAPAKSLIGSSLVFDPKVAAQLVRQGFKDAGQYWSKPKAAV